MARLYLDEDVHKKIALALRVKGYDVTSAHEVNNRGIPDYAQLEYMPYPDRGPSSPLILAIFKDCTNKYAESGKEHFGILLSKQIPFGETLNRLTRWAMGSDLIRLSENVISNENKTQRKLCVNQKQSINKSGKG
ncbi:hypothetical protein [Candidatus Kuenenia sp.]|uniref:hypothetical protein n=1 Tax=Candidatus Kuenenia sp. TaxID=2499824 RepID=UPI00321FE7E5